MRLKNRHPRKVSLGFLRGVRVDEEKRLAELGFKLPDLKFSPTHYSAKAHDVHAIPNRKVGNLLFTASIPMLEDKAFYKGTIGENLSAKEGNEACRIAAVSALAGMKYALGDLDRIEHLVRVFVFIICAPSFTDLTPIGNGATEVFHHVLGDRGLHSRADIGMTGLSGGHSVELVMTTKFRS